MPLRPDQSATFEAQHVHLVYEHIASDFSRTRHSTWPFVQQWLQRLNENSLVLDAGCGNGKYLGVDSVLSSSDRPGPIPSHLIVHKDKEGELIPKQERVSTEALGTTSTAITEERKDSEPAELRPMTESRDLDSTSSSIVPSHPPTNKAILSIGLDMSLGLLSIASKEKGHEVVRGDCFDLGCWRRGAFDHAISIATIHHFATQTRRIESIKQLINVITPSSSSHHHTPPHKILIVVWALEQDPSLSGFGSARKKGKVKGGAVRVDQFVGKEREQEGEREGEEMNEVDLKVGREDERDVFVPWELQRKEEGKPKGTRRDNKVGKKGKGRHDEDAVDHRLGEATNVVEDHISTQAKEQTFQRYYHLFKRGELTELVKAAAEELGAKFEHEGTGGKGSLRIGEAQGKVLWVRMKEERWERENWVGDIEVEWRDGSAQRT